MIPVWLNLRPLLILVLLGGLWWLLSDGDPASWIIGLPTVAAAAWTVRRSASSHVDSVSVIGLLRFIPYFLLESLRGGFDVALRTLAPTMRIQPGYLTFRTGLRRQDARVFLVNAMGLLPGTLAADLDEDRLEVHLLDASSDADADLHRLERAIARIFPESP